MILGVASSYAVSSPLSSLVFYVIMGLLFIWQVGRPVHWLWWQPQRLERMLRAQGLRGSSYRFLFGDLREFSLGTDANNTLATPLGHHDIGPRASGFLYRNISEHGKSCISWIGPVPKVTIAEPKLAMEVLSRKCGHFEKLKFPSLLKLLANGLVNHEGEKWARHRRILNRAFHLEKLKFMLPAFSACCMELVIRWEILLGSSGSCEVDIWPQLQSLTGDVISRAAFGSSYLQGRQIFQLLVEQFERITANTEKIVMPGYMYLPTENNRKMHQINSKIGQVLRGIIERRVACMKEGEYINNDLLGSLLDSNFRRGFYKNGQYASLPMTIEDVMEECRLFYIAGMETTSVLLTWTIVVLSMHLEWQDRARDEVLNLFGKSQPDYEGLSRLKIVSMILYEVLRLYPPVMLLFRKTYKPMEIGGINYPAGVVLELPVLFMHHDPDVWSSDAHEFRPDRFADGISRACNNDQAAFLPFGWGPRICIGQNFATLEAKMAMAMILQRFKFAISPNYRHAPCDVLTTLHPKHGAQIQLTAT